MEHLTEKRSTLIKRIATDTLGVLCILGAILFGWIPGPGGIPLVLAGLGLLSINHEWARRWLDRLKQSGSQISRVLFPDSRIIKASYDALSLALIILAVYLFNSHDGVILRSVATAILIFSLLLLLLNRQRAAKFRSWTAKKH